MRYIAHRGNIDGRNVIYENQPDYIREALAKGFDVEIDVWYVDNSWFLGHDKAEWSITPDFLDNSRLWLHAKSPATLYALLDMPFKNKDSINIFSHDQDNVVLTSLGIPWVYPGTPLGPRAICVMPERVPCAYTADDLAGCAGICSDYVRSRNKRVALFIAGRLSCESHRLIPQVIRAAQSGLVVDIYVSLNLSPDEYQHVLQRLEPIRRFVKGVQCVNYTAPADYVHYIIPECGCCPQNRMSMFYHNMLAFQMIQKSGVIYDVVVKFRPDLLAQDIPDVTAPMEQECIYIPDGEDYNGINDRVAYGDMTAMQTYCNIYSKIDTTLRSDPSYRLHPETVLNWHLRGHNIRRFQYSTDLDPARGRNW